MDMRIKTNINILPFGNIQYTSRGGTILGSEKARERPRYQVPGTTDIDSLEFDLVNDITLVIPYVIETEHQ